jgi:hypothetical protein
MHARSIAAYGRYVTYGVFDRPIDPVAGSLLVNVNPHLDPSMSATVTSPATPSLRLRLRAYMHGPAAPSDTLRDQKRTPDPISVSECGLHNMPIAIDRSSDTYVHVRVPYGLSQLSS